MQPTAPLGRALRRLALTTKQGPHNYYKGNRTGSMGSHTIWGGYKIDYRKVRTYVCPDLSQFRLTPFVSLQATKPETSTVMDGNSWLERWKGEGGFN